MPEFGFMGVDWEERIDYDRMRRYRLQRAREALEASDADVLIVLRMEDVRYLTGFRNHLGPVTRFASDSAVLAKGGGPVLFYTMDHVHARTRMPWLASESIRPRAVNWREYTRLKEWADDLQKMVGDLRGKKIGIDMMTVTMLHHLQELFPNSELVDGFEILSKGKMIKSEDEIECIKAATMITEAGLAAALRMLHPGVRECELLAEAWRVFTAMGSEWTQCANIITSGPSTAPYRRFTSDRVIRMGDIVIMDIGACFNGYWGDFTRTWVCGDIGATQAQKELHQSAYNSLFNACGACKVGNTNADACHAAGPNIMHVLGHSAGVNPWEPPFFSVDSKDAPVELKSGMIVNLEPYAGKPGVGGFRLENNLVVRDAGPEIFTTYPFDERLVIDVHPLDQTTGRTRRAAMR